MSQNNAGLKLSFILGAIVGVATAVMLAPDSKKVRKMAVRKGRDLMNEAKDRFSDFEDEYLEDNVEKMKDNLDYAVDTLKERSEKVRGFVKDKADEVKEEANKQILNFRTKVNSGKFDN